MPDTKSNNPVPNFYRASAEDFKKIPGSPIAYWVSENILLLFENSLKIGNIVTPRQGMSTNDNLRFLRQWFEVSIQKCGYNFSDLLSAKNSKFKWFPYNKGGDFRKWEGNKDYLVNWENDGEEIKYWLVNNPKDSKTTHWSRRIINTEFYFKEGLTWSFVSSSKFGIRYTSNGFLFDVGGSSLFPQKNEIYGLLGYLCSKVAFEFLRMLNPTLNFQTGNIASLPWLIDKNEKSFSKLNNIVSNTILLSKTDWDSYETSWDFTSFPLLSPDYLNPTIEASYKKLRSRWQQMTDEMKELEEENNRIFIDAYGLKDELTPNVPLAEITLTCNPHYRYSSNKLEEELESFLLTDTVKELISYAVGCMFGRYGLDKPGLILANQGETVGDYLSQIPNPTFRPDDDNIIPVLDDEYFTDDIVSRFKEFLKVVFGKETLSQNLDFIARALTGKNASSPEKVIRDYFLRDFYKDHVQRYKKRPIYWMFSSGKQQSFNALISMHRYNKTTLAKMRTDYLLELEAKLDAELSSLQEDTAKNKARITKIKKQIEEMKEYDELLNNKALAMIEIDLDDGVVVNYEKFEGLVRKI